MGETPPKQWPVTQSVGVFWPVLRENEFKFAELRGKLNKSADNCLVYFVCQTAAVRLRKKLNMIESRCHYIQSAQQRIVLKTGSSETDVVTNLESVTYLLLQESTLLGILSAPFEALGGNCSRAFHKN